MKSVKNPVARCAGINKGGAHSSAKGYSRERVTIADALEEYFLEELDPPCIGEDWEDWEDWGEYQEEGTPSPGCF